MKTDRINLYLQLLLNGALLLGLVLSVLVSYSLSGNSGNSADSQTLLKISLTDSILLVVILAVANLLFSKFRNHSSQNAQHLDFLTGFMTRHAFGETFKQTIAAAKCSGKALSVLLIDIDHFRSINERHGHQVGDELLVLLSLSIKNILQDFKLTCRWEGDQILVLLENCPVETGCGIAEEMLKEIRHQILEHDKKQFKITTSIGIAQMISSDNTETLTARAETGLHSARDNGRNTCAIGYDWILIDYSCDPIF